MTFRRLYAQVECWGEDRGIIQNGNPIAQCSKLIEESNEVLQALENEDLANLIEEIGDVMVVLTMICAIKNLDLEFCFAAAYNKIKNRKGFLRPDGVFVKE
jgi:NTP pyrophosphatase (non-canonical NTP hydrolase)